MSRPPDRARSTTAATNPLTGAPLRCLAHCTGCGTCVAVCATRALSLTSTQPHGRGAKTVEIVVSRCSACGSCLPACPRQALVIDSPLPAPASSLP